MTESVEQTCRPKECPFCGDSIFSDSLVFQCPACNSDYHAECWEFCGQKCGRFGCSGVATTRSERVRAPQLSALPQMMRITPREVAQTWRRVSNQSQELFGSLWESRRSFLWLCLILGPGSKLFLIATTNAVATLLGDPEAALPTLLSVFSALASASWLVWLSWGILYCALHRRYLLGPSGGLTLTGRFLISAPYLCAIGYCLGQLLLAPSHLWPSFLWGLPRGLLWLSWPLPWVGLAFGLLLAVAEYRSRDNLLLHLLILILFAWVVALNANVIGLLGLGLWLSLASAFLGWILDFFFDFDLARKFWEYGGMLFTSLTFIAGMAVGAAKFASRTPTRNQ